MTSGINRLFAALCVVMLCSAQSSWTLESLCAGLAKTVEERVSFREEKTLPYVTEPLTVQGYLVRDGNRFEKHVLFPSRESIVFAGDSVTMTSEDGRVQNVNLADIPVLQGVAQALRTSLAGDLDGLRRDFETDLSGDRAAWVLSLTPRDADVSAFLTEVRLSGAGALVQEILIADRRGTQSVMYLEHDMP